MRRRGPGSVRREVKACATWRPRAPDSAATSRFGAGRLGRVPGDRHRGRARLFRRSRPRRTPVALGRMFRVAQPLHNAPRPSSQGGLGSRPSNNAASPSRDCAANGRVRRYVRSHGGPAPPLSGAARGLVRRPPIRFRRLACACGVIGRHRHGLGRSAAIRDPGGVALRSGARWSPYLKRPGAALMPHASASWVTVASVRRSSASSGWAMTCSRLPTAVAGDPASSHARRNAARRSAACA